MKPTPCFCPVVSLATKDNPYHSWPNRDRLVQGPNLPFLSTSFKKAKQSLDKEKGWPGAGVGGKHILHCSKIPPSMVALASFHPVPNILFLGKPTKKPLRHTTQPETTNLDHWSPVQSRVRPGCARNHLDNNEDSLLAADEQRIHTWLPEHSCGYRHCQPQDTIVPHKEVTEIQKTLVAWFKFPVEEGIKEHW